MSGHATPEEIRKETRIYLMVFAGLAVLTAVTVAVSYLHLSIGMAVLVALFIASIKGFLVAGYFMHLLSEKKLIYGVLMLTVFFFAVLLWGPWHHHYDTFGR
ncbi:MAG TPA: cytochrome C oxidase subunit IV family protein [Thermoanaerobaculia bacterium]|nr:cytochrome C oxidase subunit IV family protein [Thermoanaerobaculia bacterium]